MGRDKGLKIEVNNTPGPGDWSVNRAVRSVGRVGRAVNGVRVVRWVVE